VYAIVYSLGATRCIILHLATSESLRHAFGGEDTPLLVYGLMVAAVALVMVQASLAGLLAAHGVFLCSGLLWRGRSVGMRDKRQTGIGLCCRSSRSTTWAGF
jgi:hypothetical protein